MQLLGYLGYTLIFNDFAAMIAAKKESKRRFAFHIVIPSGSHHRLCSTSHIFSGDVES